VVSTLYTKIYVATANLKKVTTESTSKYHKFEAVDVNPFVFFPSPTRRAFSAISVVELATIVMFVFGFNRVKFVVFS
jgi:hypothetical protein